MRQLSNEEVGVIPYVLEQTCFGEILIRREYSEQVVLVFPETEHLGHLGS